MEGYGLVIPVLLPLLVLVAATLHLATRPARGPGSVEASVNLQAAVLAASLAWGLVSGFVAFVALVLVLADLSPPLWPAVGAGLLVAALCVAWLGRPWGGAGTDGDLAGSQGVEEGR